MRQLEKAYNQVKPKLLLWRALPTAEARQGPGQPWKTNGSPRSTTKASNDNALSGSSPGKLSLRSAQREGDDLKSLFSSPNSQSLKDQRRGEDDTAMAMLHLSPGVGHPAQAVLVPEDAASNPPGPLVLPEVGKVGNVL